MGQYKKSTLTAAGERLVAQAIGGEIKLNITKVKTSNHQYPDGTNFKSLVDMDGIVQTMVGPKTAVYNDTLIQTRALFSNEEVKETYYIHNIGLYAMDGSEEVLFSISSATTPDEMPKYDGVAPTTCIYNIQNTISETSSVSLTINPAGYASIADIMELDEKKIDKTGDISETTINALDEPATDVQFPVPVAGESTKTFLGKVKKFFEDTKNWMTGVCLIGQIVNNCVTNNAKLPLSAAQGKVLMDLYTVLNTKSEWKLLRTVKGRQEIELPQQGTFSEFIAIVSYTYSVTRNYFIAVPALSLSDTEQRANIGTGRGGDLGENVSVSLVISATHIKLATFIFDGIARESDAILTVYYK